MPSLVCLAGTASFLLHDVSPHTNEPQTGNCCRPGDITVTQIPTGYLLGRALEQKGPGPWWSYILTVPAFDRAIELARNFAAHAQVQAWLHKSGDNYELLSDPILATSPELTAQQAEEARLDAWATELESRSAQMVAAYVTPEEREHHRQDLEQLSRDVHAYQARYLLTRPPPDTVDN